MEEIWRDVKGFEDKYQVSNLGRVKSKERYFKNHNKSQKVYEKILLQRKQYGKIDNEYMIVSLTEKHKSKFYYVHRLVAEAFLNNYDKNLQVNHKDGDKTNNNINNLEMMTRSQNQLHAYCILKRRTNGKAILQYDLENNFIKEYKSVCMASRETNICRSSINDCCRNKCKTAGSYIWKYKY